MGLDMYLTKKTYVKNWSHMSPEQLHEITVKKGGEPRTDIKPERISSIEESVAYWRKANHIHKWFVDNVQDGEDNCREYYVSHEQLQQLVDECKKVKESLEKSGKKTIQVESGWSSKEGKTFMDVDVYTDTSVAEELLPTQSGFFFGSTDVDEWYWGDIEHTIKTLESALNDRALDNWDFEYQSSW